MCTTKKNMHTHTPIKERSVVAEKERGEMPRREIEQVEARITSLMQKLE